MNVKITLAITICVVALLCMTTLTECIKFKDALKHMGQATEKIGPKDPDDGLISGYLGSKIVKRSVDSVLKHSHNPDIQLWHNEPPILLNRLEADESLDRKILPAPY